MEFIYISTVALLAFTAESSTALECYTCTSQPANPDAPTLEPGANNCDDPFNMTGITKTTCTGRCFARLDKSMTGEVNTTVSERGCIMGNTCLQGCQWRSGPPGDGSLPQFGEAPPGAYSSRCDYCCEDDLCNAMPITAETAAEQYRGSRKCWNCTETKAEATAGSCASDDFNGKGATQVDCNAQCVLIKGPIDGVDSVYRSCDEITGQMCQEPGAECCPNELCNGSDDDEDDDNDGENDGEVEPIECWKCEAADTTESVCAKGEFKDMDKDNDNDKDMDAYAMLNYTKVSCPTGKCVSMIATPSPSPDFQVYMRGCVMPLLKDICEEGAEDNKFRDEYKDIKCCEKHLCNGAPVIVSSSAAIFVGIFFVFFAFM